MTTDTLAAGADTSEAGQQNTDGDNTGGTGAQAPQTNGQGQQPLAEGAQGEGAEGKQGEGDGGKGDEGKQGGAVTFELKLPNGVELDQAAADEFKAIVGDKALTESQRAQKIVDLAVKREAGRIEAHQARINEWAESVKTDPELGGDKLPETLAVARKAVDLGPPELKEFLNASGLGNHPAVVRWAYTVGKALSEDRFVRGQAPQARGSAESLLYPTSTAKA